MVFISLMIRFCVVSGIVAGALWTFCYLWDIDEILGKVTPRIFKEYVCIEDDQNEETQLKRVRKVRKGKILKAFLQMVVIEVLGGPIIFPINLFLAVKTGVY